MVVLASTRADIGCHAICLFVVQGRTICAFLEKTAVHATTRYMRPGYEMERVMTKHLKRVVVVNDGADLGCSYYTPFSDIAPAGLPELLFTNPEEVLCVLFTGGEDVDPSFYGCKKNRKTYSSIPRDEEEKIFFDKALQHRIPMVGICRGAQFLCVMSGGKLVQHVDGHSCGAHTVNTLRGVVTLTSTHHQMQLPPTNAKILAWAEPRLSQHYEGADRGDELNPPAEYEGVYYPNTRALGMQWHPEVMQKSSPGYLFTQSLISKLLQSVT